MDLAQLSAFLDATRPDIAEALDLGNDSPTRRKFLARLQGEISKNGIIHVLRNGLSMARIRSTYSMAHPSRQPQRRSNATPEPLFGHPPAALQPR